MRVQSLIESILSTSNQARQDDKYLQLRVWDKQGFHLTEEQRKIFFSKRISAPETIRRVRQKLQEQGKYRPVEEVYEARQEKAKMIRHSIPHTLEPLKLFED